IRFLDHPNGFWRDTAQKLLVQRDDKRVVPALVKMAQQHKDHLARIHALWTLEGLESLDSSLLREKMANRNEHPQVRIAAIRASESLHKRGDESLTPHIRALANDPDPDVVIQTMLTANFMKWKDATRFIDSTMKIHPARGVQEIGAQLLLPDVTEGRDFTSAEKKMLRRGATIYAELCFACHASDGKGMPLEGAKEGLTIAPPLAGSKTVTGISDALLHVMLKGLTGPVDGKTYDSLMVAMESNDDEWIAAVSSYVRNSFGNNASLISAKDVARVRDAYKQRTQPWTLDEIDSVLPKFLTNRPNWKVSASDNNDTAGNAIDDKLDTRYDTKRSQAPDMWFKVELPEETLISGVYLDAGKSAKDFPRKYKVEVSKDGAEWGKPLATGSGNARTTEILFKPTTTKFVRITQTDSAKGIWWSIHDLQLMQPPDQAVITATQTKKAEASAFE
ncbi:MAG: discoidin domain-containing protein, partial [Limisphaerales bacterium]